MKLVQWIAAAGFVATGLVGATAAEAQDWRYRDHHERGWERHDRHDRWERHRGWDRERRWDRGRYYDRSGYYDRGGYGYRSRTVCWDEWRHGRRIEVCRRR